MTQRVLLVKPPYVYYPLGLAYVASTLERARIEYDYLDAAQERPDLARLLAGDRYSVLASGGLVGDFPFLEELFTQARAVAPEVVRIMGGCVTRDVDARVLFEHIPVDYAVVGEAERSLPELLAALSEDPSRIPHLRGILHRDADGRPVRHLPQRRLDLMTDRVFPSRKFFDHACWPVARLPIPVLTGRGCVGKCTFCSPTHRQFVPRPLADVFTEIDELLSLVAMPQVHLMNEVVFSDPEMIMEFCREYKARYDLPFFCVVRADFDPDILPHLKAAGCVSFNLGIESGSDRVLKAMHKGITVSQSRAFVRRAQDLGGFTISSGFMIGNEDEGEEDVEQTVQLHEELNILSGISPTVPYPGTPIFRRALRRGIINEEYDFLRRLSSIYLIDFRSELWFTRDDQGRTLQPNLTRIADDRFPAVMHQAYQRMYRHYALREPRLELEGDRRVLRGACPVCGAPFQTEFTTDLTYLNRLACSGVQEGRCYNDFEFHADLFDLPGLRADLESLAGKLRDCRRIFLCGEPLVIKHMFDQDLLGFPPDRIQGVGTEQPHLLGHCLYEAPGGYRNPSTCFLPLDALAALEPDAVVIADASMHALELEDDLVLSGVPRERIHLLLPPGRLPWPAHRRFRARRLDRFPKQEAFAIWPAGLLGQRLLGERVLPADRLVTYADSACTTDGHTALGHPVCHPSRLGDFDFPVLVIASEPNFQDIFKAVQADPDLRSRRILRVSERYELFEMVPV